MSGFDIEAFRDAAGIGEDAPPVGMQEILNGISQAADLVMRDVDAANARADAAEAEVEYGRAAAERAQLADAAISHIEGYEYENEDEPWLLANRIATDAPDHLDRYLDAWADAEGDEAVAHWERARGQAEAAHLAAQVEHARRAAAEAEQERRAAVLAEMERLQEKAGPLAPVALDLLQDAVRTSGVNVAEMPPEDVREILASGLRAAQELKRADHVSEFRDAFRQALPLSSKLARPDWDPATSRWLGRPGEPVNLDALSPKPSRAEREAQFREAFRAAAKEGGLLP